MNALIDMTGWVMSEHGVPDSRLTVIERGPDYIGANGKRRARWLCECSCPEHKRILARSYEIREGRIKSCGCLARENSQNTIKKAQPLAVKSRKKTNIYSEKLSDEHGEYYVIYSNPHQEEIGFIDANNYDKVFPYSWCVKDNGYFCTCIDGKIVHLHTFLFGQWIDHKDGNRLNNRQYNVRECTCAENLQNAKKRKVGKSGYRGVAMVRGHYRAHIQYTENGITHKITGRERLTAEEAYVDYLTLAAKYHKNFSAVLDDIKKYGIEIPET